MDLTSAMSVVSMLTLSFSDLGSSSVDAMMSLAGRLRSQRGRNGRGILGVGTSLGFSIGSVDSSISGILSTDKTANRLWVDGEGVLFTRRLWENPPPPSALTGRSFLAPGLLCQVGSTCPATVPVTRPL
jgi:hypothetical protein